MLEPSTLICRALTDDDLEHVLADLRKSDTEVLRLSNIQDIL